MDPVTTVKVVAEVVVITGSISGAVYGFVTIINSVKATAKQLSLLATNHLPQIQDSLNKQDVAIAGIRTEVKGVDNRLTDHVTRFEDTKRSVDRINDMMIQKALKTLGD